MPSARRVAGLFAVKLIDRTPEVQAKLNEEVRRVVNETSVSLQALASQMAPRDTGALANSIYVNDGEHSDYATRVGYAENLNANMQALEELDPEFVIPLSSTGGQAYTVVVGVAAHYGLFLEYGTVFQPPQSFMLPASESMNNQFESAMHNIHIEP